MMEGHDKDEALLAIILILLSAIVWLTFGAFNNALALYTQYTPGIDLVYLPAGVRVGIILIFGIWGAIGITLASPFLIPEQFGVQPFTEIAINSFITGFVPLLTVIAVCRLMRIDRNLTTFHAIHLPIMALAASITTPFAFNINFILSGFKSLKDLLPNLSAMMLGDFLGCLIVLIVMRTTIYIYRQHSGDVQK